MSNLPTVDPQKVLQRNNQKLTTSLSDATLRESQLEILAEALRDERDKALADLAELQQKQGEQ